MPEKEIADQAYRLLPWIVGIIASIVGLFIRNEWTTKAMKDAMFRPNGDVRLVRISDCETCRQKCQEGIERQLTAAKAERQVERSETRDDINRLHTKIDDLPQRIITMMREARRPSDRPTDK